MTMSFGGVVALEDVRVRIGPGEICGLIGPNGAGKSTLVNVIAGVYRPDAGTVSMSGVPVGNLSVTRRARRGLARTFQAPAPFGTLTIHENLDMARRFRRRTRRQLEDDQVAWLEDLVDDMGLTPWLHVPARHAPHPVQKVTDVLRSLFTAPTALLVDEPAAGLAKGDRDRLVGLLGAARERLGIGVLIIEHDVPLVFDLCERLTVLNFGRLIAEGTPEEIRRHPDVREAYLGTRA